MSIHTGHPFATPPQERDAARRFRGRLVAPVTLWLSGAGRARAGLTVSSVLVALGEPARVIALLDPDTDLTVALLREGVGTVVVLDAPDRALADAFAGLAPAPGGPFRLADFDASAWGPVLPGRAWAGVRVESSRSLGWSTEVVAVIEQVAIDGDAPLTHHQGRYRHT